MKTKLLFLFVWLMLAITGCSAGEPQTEESTTPPVEKTEEPVEPSGDKKVLIVYFSHTGNTRTIAGYIHDTVKSDLVEIQTADTYTDDYDTLLAQIREEVASGYCPPLTTNIENLSSYDVIFIGYPIWVETAAPPIRTFLTTHDLAGRTVVRSARAGPALPRQATGLSVPFARNRLYWRAYRFVGERMTQLMNGLSRGCRK